jgi:hypothetical protein
MLAASDAANLLHEHRMPKRREIRPVRPSGEKGPVYQEVARMRFFALPATHVRPEVLTRRPLHKGEI